MLPSSITSRTLRETALATVVSLGFLLSGCGGATTQFEPVRASARPSATYPVTSYKLEVGPSVLGSAVVWSEGAAETSQPDGQILDLEMSIRNATGAPLNVDVAHAAVNVRLRDGRTQSLGNARRIGGSSTVPPGGSGRIGLHYALPADFPAHDLAGFDFSWRVASHAGDYAQSTAFVPTPLTASSDMTDTWLPCNGPFRPITVNDCIVDAPPLAPTTNQPLR